MSSDTLASADDLRVFLNLDEIDPARASLILRGVSQDIRSEVRSDFLSYSETEVIVDGSGSALILFPYLPLIGISQIKSGNVTLTENTYTWNSKGLIAKIDGGQWGRYSTYAVTATYGPMAIPDDIFLLTLRVAARAWQNPTSLTQETASGLTSGYGQGISILTDEERDMLHRRYGV